MIDNQNLVYLLAFGGMASYSLYLNLKLAFCGTAYNHNDDHGLNNQIIVMTVAISIIFFILAIFFNYQPYFVEDEEAVPIINPVDLLHDVVIMDCDRPMQS